MATKNDVTGDTIQSRTNSKQYAENWSKIFGKKDKVIIERNPDEKGNKQDSK